MNNFIKAALAFAAGATLAVAAPLAAMAHVTIEPEKAEPGSYTLITVKVPNESDTELTSRVELHLPLETPFTSVRFVSVPGWDAELVRSKFLVPIMVGDTEISEAVTSIIWTAQAGSELGDGELLLLPISLGPVPDVGSVALNVEQTYTDGNVVSWSETGEGDLEKPAPVLYVNDKPSGHHDAVTSDDNAQGDNHADESEHTEAEDGSDTVARGLGIAGLVAGLAAIVLAFAFRRPTNK